MAGRIAGITVEIDANASKFQSAIKGIDKELSSTRSTLKDVNKLLKLDPTNTTLLTQKQKALQDAVDQTKQRLETLRNEQKNVAEGTAEWDGLQREIIETEQKLKAAETALKEFGSVTSQQLKAAGAKMKEFGGKVEDVGKKLSKISGAAAGALAALGKIGYDAMQSADELNTLSQQTGLSVDTLQKWSYAADLVDVDLNTMTGALSKLEKSMTGHGETWEKLGVSVTDADGNMRDAESVFYDTLTALSQIENETERDQVAMDLFGKSANELAGIVDDGGQALKRYGEEAEAAGLIMSEDMVDSLNTANDTVDKMKKNVSMSFAQLGGTLIEKFGPALEKVADLIGTVTEKLRSLSPEQSEMIVKVLGVVAVIGPLVMGIGKIISIAGTLVSGIGAVVGVLGGPLTIAIAAAIAIGVLLWKNWDKIKAFALQLAESVKAAWENLKAGVISAATAVASGATNAWNTLKTGVTTAVEGVKTVVTTAWDGIKTAVSSVIDGIKAKIQTLIDKFNNLKTKAQDVVDKIKSIFSGEISFPKIKLPHFNVTGGVAPYGLGGQGSMPKIDISWYKKAYENPVMFTSPTVLPTAAGMKGFGDGAGAEIVMGLDKLRELVSTGQHVDVNVYLMGDARQLFKVVKVENNVRTRATNYNALAVGG